MSDEMDLSRPTEMTALTPAEEIAYLRAENDRLQALVDGRFKDAAEARLVRAGPDADGKFTIDIQSTLVPMIAEHMAVAFKAMGGENYVQFELGHDELGPLVLTLQRKWGELPATIATRERARADKAEAELARLRGSVDEGTDF